MYRATDEFQPVPQWSMTQAVRNARRGSGSDEDELSLDDFDRALLAESNRGSGSSYGDQTRVSFPPVLTAAATTINPGEISRETCDQVSLPPPTSSSTFPISSPTVIALQNRHTAPQRPVNGHHSYHSQMSSKQANTNRPFKEHLPAHKSTHDLPVIQGITLVSTSALPDSMRSIFRFPLFNAVQSRCFPHAFGSSNNLIVSAPTGSGKTAIMELAICRLLTEMSNNDFKVIYQAPTRSLCGERHRDWSAKFHSLGLKCAELTGDVEFANLKNIQQADVIIATPEKWDSVTRKWKDNARLMRMIKLFLVDEVHILKETRGATLEAVVARMKSVGTDVRFVALSATVPNSEDVAAWLGLNSGSQNVPAIREVFGDEFRPTDLVKHVIGFRSPPNHFILDGLLIKEIPAIIAKYSNRKPVMIFCPTQKSAVKMAKSLATLWGAASTQSQLWSGPKRPINVRDPELRITVNAGVAFHHGGLDANDRAGVEQGFIDGNMNVICSTSTLAVGVNLPCYLVILKGTSCYTDTGMQEYSILEVMQMLGRAGRPQYETSACAVILTSNDRVARYEKLISGQELLESSLHDNFIEHLNAEIGLGTIKDAASAQKWLRSTFLYVRLQHNPAHYKLYGSSQYEDRDELLESICQKNLQLLNDADIIKKTDMYRCTDFGHAMTRYYVKFETMKSLLKLAPRAKLSEVLDVLVQAAEFHDLRWKTGEKGLFKKINKSNEIRYPVKVDIALPSHKASLVLQAALGAYVLDKDDRPRFELQLQQDTKMVLAHCSRLIRCIIDVQLSLHDATSAKSSLEMARSIAAKVWDNTAMQLKQIEGIGDVTARRLAARGITSIDALSSADSHQIELILGKNPPFGGSLLSKVSRFPSLRVSIQEVTKKRNADGGAEVQLRCEIAFLNDPVPIYFNKKFIYVCFLCETSCGKLIDFRRFGANRMQHAQDVALTVKLDRPTGQITCHVMCDTVAGTHRYAELTLDIPKVWYRAGLDGSLPIMHGRAAGPVARANVDDACDDFLDAEFRDGDFLTVEADTCSHPTTVVDVDDYIAKNTQGTKPSISKRKLDAGDSVDGESTQWREPTRLPNGNWTCQHACMQEDKECKHQCCKEGVKKPRKRPKAKQEGDVGIDANKLPAAIQPKPEICKTALGNADIRPALGNADIRPALEKSYTARSQNGDAAEPSDSVALHTRITKPSHELSCPLTFANRLSDGCLDANQGVDGRSFSYATGCDNVGSTAHKQDLDEFDDDFGVLDVEYFELGHGAQPCGPLLHAGDESTDQEGIVRDKTIDATPAARVTREGIPECPPPPLNEHLPDRPVCLRLIGQPFTPAKPMQREKTIKSDGEDDYGHWDFNTDLALTNFDSLPVLTPASVDRGERNGQIYDHDVPGITEKRTKLETARTASHFFSLLRPTDQVEVERRKKEHELDQKQKWSDLEPWMFERFGNCVDIV